MKFSQKKFIGFSKEKQIKTLLEFIREIEQSWSNKGTRVDLLKELRKCLNYLNNNLADKIEMDLSIRDFHKIVIPFEQKYGKNLKDHDFLVLDQDGSQQVIEKIPLFFILDNFRSSFNVGSIFRTAECLSVKKIFLCGYTATPENEKVRKTAMGTDNKVEWGRFEKTESAIKLLRDKNITIYALETTTNAKSIFDILFKKPCALVLGNEALGISKEILKLADEIVSIPVKGWKNSLNVGVSCAVCGYEIKRQWERVVD